MNRVAKLSFLILIAVLPHQSRAAVAFSGTALNQTPSLAAGNYGVFLSLTAGSDWSSLSGITPGTTFTTGSTYSFAGNNFTAFGANTASSFLGSTSLSGNVASFNYSSFTGLAGNQQFAYLLFLNSTQASSGVTAGTALSVWRSSDWVLPSDPPGGNFTFAASGGTFTQLGSGSSATVSFDAVPEPSTYALLAMSGLALGGYLIRRRRGA